MKSIKRGERLTILLIVLFLLGMEKEDAPVLIHGIIDGYFVGDDGLELFDYKTDHD